MSMYYVPLTGMQNDVTDSVHLTSHAIVLKCDLKRMQDTSLYYVTRTRSRPSAYIIWGSRLLIISKVKNIKRQIQSPVNVEWINIV